MSNNREILAKHISKKFIDAISGNDKNQILEYNPEDRIFVGKLSAQNTENNFSSNVLIKQIGVDFRIPKKDIDVAELNIYPQGNFFFRVIPSFQQQKEFFLKDFNAVFKREYKTFDELLKDYKSDTLTSEMKAHRVQLLPVYEKIALERNCVSYKVKIAEFYNKELECGEIPQDSAFYTCIRKDVDDLNSELHSRSNIVCCNFAKLTFDDLISDTTWESYKKKQRGRADVSMFTNFNYSLMAKFDGIGECVNITIALSNETMYGDESETHGPANCKSNDKYRINTLFNSGLRVECVNTKFLPIELDYFSDDYKYDKNVFALGNNCNVEYDEKNVAIQTTHVPKFMQYRLKTRDDLAVRFDDLINDPINTLNKVYEKMLLELKIWEKDYARGINLASEEPLSEIAKSQFKKEIDGFNTEIKRFHTGICLIEKYNMIKQAFCYMNMA
ncbi:MAG: hypothetical protein K2M17_01450, partial [Bacilli bacterium]|nr:hypothetical protein [Bacilli bacterium]